MDDQILAIYGLCTDFLTARHHAEDRKQKMTDAEVMTTALVAMVFCGGNFEHARARLGTRQYMPTMLSRGRFNRRLPLIRDGVFCPMMSWLQSNRPGGDNMTDDQLGVLDNNTIYNEL